ncbi:MAG: hypothetical protein GF317_04255 [Candidatus Lokiarchaeota archaeon]|nr:hypothetical protein [Candidatus Lokiarchaeota archaeon]MBD3199101.1 hypothetical protein [Candidatus Lokiarchaeota archaeon]
MSDIFHFFNGKLYDKKCIKQWNLPPKMEEQIGLTDYEYFFLTSSKEEQKHGELPHVHLSIFPTHYETVFLLEVETSTILPELLHNTLKILKESGNTILTSTGFCTHADLCHFGIFFSNTELKRPNNIVDSVKNLDKVREVDLFEYNCEGCEQVK